MSSVDAETRDALIVAAWAVRACAYAPYSKFAVGAALLDEDGRIFSGANVENASYSLTICAERAAVFAAIGQGAHHLRAIAIVSAMGAPPCGAYRQVLAEFTSADFEVFIVNSDGVWQRYFASELWPLTFTKDNLTTAFSGRASETSQEKEKRS